MASTKRKRKLNFDPPDSHESETRPTVWTPLDAPRFLPLLLRPLTWNCMPAVSGGTRLWPSLGSIVGSVESSIKGFWKSCCTGLKFPEIFSSSANDKFKTIVHKNVDLLIRVQPNACKPVKFSLREVQHSQWRWTSSFMQPMSCRHTSSNSRSRTVWRRHRYGETGGRHLCLRLDSEQSCSHWSSSLQK